MRNRFNVDSDEKRRIISLHENSLKMNYLNLIVEQAQPTWLKYPNDKTYEYLKKDNKWFTRRIGTTKEFDLSSNPKYKETVNNLNKTFPDGKAPAGTTTTTTTASTQSNNVSQDFSNAISSVIQKVGGQEGLGNSISTVFQQFSQNPETKAIIDKLTASGVDISKLQPAQIIPTLKQYDTSGILKIDPKLIPSVNNANQEVNNANQEIQNQKPVDLKPLIGKKLVSDRDDNAAGYKFVIVKATNLNCKTEMFDKGMIELQLKQTGNDGKPATKGITAGKIFYGYTDLPTNPSAIRGMEIQHSSENDGWIDPDSNPCKNKLSNFGSFKVG